MRLSTSWSVINSYIASAAEDAIAVATMIEVDERDLFVGSHTEFVLQCLGDTLKPQLRITWDAHRG